MHPAAGTIAASSARSISFSAHKGEKGGVGVGGGGCVCRRGLQQDTPLSQRQEGFNCTPSMPSGRGGWGRGAAVGGQKWSCVVAPPTKNCSLSTPQAHGTTSWSLHPQMNLGFPLLQGQVPNQNLLWGFLDSPLWDIGGNKLSFKCGRYLSSQGGCLNMLEMAISTWAVLCKEPNRWVLFPTTHARILC